MKKIKYLLLTLFTLAFSVTVFGQSDVVICNNCSNSEQEIRAKSSVNYNTKTIIVVDIINEKAKKFNTFYSEDRFREPLINVYETGLNSNELYDLDLLYQYRKELVSVVTLAANKSMLVADSVINKNNVSVTSSSNSTDNYAVGKVIKVGGSPYDFMTNSSIRNDIYDFYFRGSTNGLTQILSQTMKTIKLPNMNQLGVYIKIEFYSDDLGEVPNGFVSVALKLETESFKILGGRDGFNNSIPLTRSDVNGRQFNFSGSSEGSKEKTMFESYIIPFGGGGSGGCSVTSTEVRGDRVIYTYQC